MVTFGTIIERNTRVKYTKTDVEGYKVEGEARYDKENALVDANGRILAEDKKVAEFTIYGQGEYAKINLTDCEVEKMGVAAEIAQATLADLKADYPRV